MHRDVLPRYPSSASVEPIGHSDRGEVQGIYVKNRIFTLQGHPEYDADIATDFLERRHGTVLDEATYQDGKDRVQNPHDSLTIGARFLLFLLEG
jgi:GMP synthase-like glutamine amidotransferase